MPNVFYASMDLGAAGMAPYDVDPVGCYIGASLALSVAIFWDRTNKRFVLVSLA